MGWLKLQITGTVGIHVEAQRLPIYPLETKFRRLYIAANDIAETS
jgi:hypothetical protein